MHQHRSEEEALDAFRQAKDEFFRTDPYSPLTPEQQTVFDGLSYYPYNPSLDLRLPLDRDVSDEPVVMDTSTGDRREYRRAGKIRFEVKGEPAELTIYEGPEGDLFLPLRDVTSGKETYGAGRYLEPEWLDEDSVEANFNLLYNPYCAYNDAYSCPLPPLENWLQVPIEAGEKKFHE